MMNGVAEEAQDYQRTVETVTVERVRQIRAIHAASLSCACQLRALLATTPDHAPLKDYLIAANEQFARAGESLEQALELAECIFSFLQGFSELSVAVQSEKET